MSKFQRSVFWGSFVFGLSIVLFFGTMVVVDTAAAQPEPVRRPSFQMKVLQKAVKILGERVNELEARVEHLEMVMSGAEPEDE